MFALSPRCYHCYKNTGSAVCHSYVQIKKTKGWFNDMKKTTGLVKNGRTGYRDACEKIFDFWYTLLICIHLCTEERMGNKLHNAPQPHRKICKLGNKRRGILKAEDMQKGTSWKWNALCAHITSAWASWKCEQMFTGNAPFWNAQNLKTFSFYQKYCAKQNSATALVKCLKDKATRGVKVHSSILIQTTAI